MGHPQAGRWPRNTIAVAMLSATFFFSSTPAMAQDPCGFFRQKKQQTLAAGNTPYHQRQAQTYEDGYNACWARLRSAGTRRSGTGSGGAQGMDALPGLIGNALTLFNLLNPDAPTRPAYNAQPSGPTAAQLAAIERRRLDTERRRLKAEQDERDRIKQAEKAARTARLKAAAEAQRKLEERRRVVGLEPCNPQENTFCSEEDKDGVDPFDVDTEQPFESSAGASDDDPFGDRPAGNDTNSDEQPAAFGYDSINQRMCRDVSFDPVSECLPDSLRSDLAAGANAAGKALKAITKEDFYNAGLLNADDYLRIANGEPEAAIREEKMNAVAALVSKRLRDFTAWSDRHTASAAPLMPNTSAAEDKSNDIQSVLGDDAAAIPPAQSTRSRRITTCETCPIVIDVLRANEKTRDIADDLEKNKQKDTDDPNYGVGSSIKPE